MKEYVYNNVKRKRKIKSIGQTKIKSPINWKENKRVYFNLIINLQNLVSETSKIRLM